MSKFITLQKCQDCKNKCKKQVSCDLDISRTYLVSCGKKKQFEKNK